MTRGSLRRATVTAIPLDAPLVSHAHNPAETSLLLACNNGVLALHCESRGMTHLTKAGLIPSRLAWLATGSLLAVANDRGQVQLFDAALSLVRAQLALEDAAPQRVLELGDACPGAAALRGLRWAADRPLLVLRWATGPLACLRVAGAPHAQPLALLYARHRQWDEAVNLLVSLSWEAQGRAALRCLLAVGGGLLRLPLGAAREAQIEAALSSFLLSPVRVSAAVEQEFGPPVRALTRRFFFKLLR